MVRACGAMALVMPCPDASPRAPCLPSRRVMRELAKCGPRRIAALALAREGGLWAIPGCLIAVADAFAQRLANGQGRGQHASDAGPADLRNCGQLLRADHVACLDARAVHYQPHKPSGFDGTGASRRRGIAARAGWGSSRKNCPQSATTRQFFRGWCKTSAAQRGRGTSMHHRPAQWSDTWMHKNRSMDAVGSLERLCISASKMQPRQWAPVLIAWRTNK